MAELKTQTPVKRLRGSLPKIGIRPVIDGRMRGVRESLEAQTMNMAEKAAELLKKNLRHPNGMAVECVIADTTIGGVAEAAMCTEKFQREGVGVSLTVTPCWCYGTEVMDTDPLTPKAVWGFNGTERPGAVYLAAALAGYTQKGLPAFGIYGHDVQDKDDDSIPDDVARKLLLFAKAGLAVAEIRGKSYLSMGSVSMGIAGSIVDDNFFHDYLGMRNENIDMSEFMEKFSVTRLIGSPPGYVGYEEGGELTEKVRRKPYSVVLLDEIEKAHPEVFNILLQVMDEGRLSDALHHTVDFRNVVLIMTSNLGAEYIKKTPGIGFRVESEKVYYQDLKKKLLEEVKKTFRPEFLNRLDEIIVFKPLTQKDLRAIIDLMLKDIEERLSAQNVKIKLSLGAKNLIIERGYDPSFGARPLKRTLERMVEDPLAELLLRGDIPPGSTVEGVVIRGKLRFRLPEKELIKVV